MKVGTKSIPEFRLSIKLISDVRTLYEKFGNAEIDFATAAEVLGHKSHKSGTFLYKVSTMRCYGLVDGRGKIAVTDIGQKIAYKENDIDYNNSLISAIERVTLWSLIFNKFDRNGKTIQDNDFWIELRDNCSLTIEEAKKLAPETLKAYREDTRLINMSLATEEKAEGQPPQENYNSNNDQKPPSDMLDIGYENYKVYLPRDQEEQIQVWKRLKKMVDSYINPDDE